jgi:LmbE family N-acetylglucosaminyl deacetylase
VPSLLLVHAHPDDESLFSGLLTLRAKQRGWWVTLATLTDGRLGFDPMGRDGLETDHDAEATALLRHQELVAACGHLGIDELVHLGYRDSGMAGWSSNQDPRALAAAPLSEIARQVGRLMDTVGADLVVTYGSDGFYGHPDHLACHGAVSDALEERSTVAFLAPVVAVGELAPLAASLADQGSLLPDWLGADLAPGVDPDAIAGSITNPHAAPLKQAALACHRSQRDNELFAQLEAEAFGQVLGTEHYQLCQAGNDHAHHLALSLLD